MKAVILAAGVGSRLRPITNKLPKSLVHIGNKRILDYQVEGYLSAGLNQEDIYIVTGYMADKIEDHVAKVFPKVKLIKNTDYLSTNNMYSLYLAIKTMGIEEPNSLLINNADCLYEKAIFKQIIESPIENLIACKKDIYDEESMKIIVKNERIINISKQISEEDSYGVSLDLYKFGRKAFASLKKIISRIINEENKINLWTELAFPELFTETDVFPQDTKSLGWVEVDNMNDLLLADSTFSAFKISRKKAMLCDLDGTLYIGKTPITSAVNYINENPNDLDLYFFSNNTSRTPDEFVEKLKKFGVNTSVERIITPLSVLIKYIKDKDYKSIFLIANLSVENYLSKELPGVSFKFDKEQNQLLVLTYDTEITYDKLMNASILLNKGDVQYWATHADIFCPNELGPIPDIGSFIKLLEVTTSKSPNLILGKPSATMLEPLLEHYSKDEIFLVGDRTYTDMRMAYKAGCDFVCVLSGETNREDLALLNPEDGFPTMIITALGEVAFK